MVLRGWILQKWVVHVKEGLEIVVAAVVVEVLFLQVVVVVVAWAVDLKEAEEALVQVILILAPFYRVVVYLEEKAVGEEQGV